MSFKFNGAKSFVLGLCFISTFGNVYGMQPLIPKSSAHHKVELATVLARLVTTLGASYQETPSKKWNIAANASRELNTLASNFVPYEGTLSPSLEAAQLSYIGSIVTSLVNTEKYLGIEELMKQAPKKRTKANRALLVALALVESGAMIGACCSDSSAPYLADLAALASVVHSIASAQDKHSQLMHVATLVYMIKLLSERYCIVVAQKLNRRSGPSAQMNPGGR